ncbi:hypothetical protein HO133_003170 [Letharia lupina]|uniref:Uncharacterized protein n=1 Tax=Letharia lupina TaxID=560253 RepID=A0A8H6CC56_9LECA|nr:uncharacterized protein HO133_003170 [Letharia lupina]KAF6220737.1 hypothetical protein HO133_003170 [Letharia lupina]
MPKHQRPKAHCISEVVNLCSETRQDSSQNLPSSHRTFALQDVLLDDRIEPWGLRPVSRTSNTEVRRGSFNAGQVFVPGDLRSFRVLEKLKADTLPFIESSPEENTFKAVDEEFETARQMNVCKGNHHCAFAAKERKNLVDKYIHDAINTVGQVHRPEVSLPASLEQMTPLLTTTTFHH